MQQENTNHPDSEKPPVLGKWRNLYLLVLGNLIFLIVLFYAITKIYE
jgi:hypothetical protein